jgi:hypothetical protein
MMPEPTVTPMAEGEHFVDSNVYESPHQTWQENKTVQVPNLGLPSVAGQ